MTISDHYDLIFDSITLSPGDEHDRYIYWETGGFLFPTQIIPVGADDEFVSIPLTWGPARIHGDDYDR